MAWCNGERYLDRFGSASRRILEIEEGMTMQGSTRIDELKQKFHENPRRYFAPLANEYRKAGDPEQAIAICRAHLAQQPGHMSGHVVYGQALYDAKRMDEARTVFEKALSLDPENVIVLRHLGDIARQGGKSEEAKHWYSKALDVDPQDTEIAAYLAELTEPLMAEAVASPAHEPAEREVPLELVTPEDYAIDTESAELTDEVADETPSIKHTPQSPFVTRTMAELYLQQGHRSAALEIYRQLAESDPDNEELTARIAELSARQTPTAEVPAVADHFSEAELAEGDTWDTDVWAAGFSGEDPAVADAFSERDVQSSLASEEREPAEAARDEPAEVTAPEQISAETRQPESAADEESIGEATADEDYLDALPTAESFELEQPQQKEESVAEPAQESDLVAYSPPVPEPVTEEATAAPATPVAAATPATPAISDTPPPGDGRAPSRTVREFFATLGARRPPEIPDRRDPEIAEDQSPSERAVDIPEQSDVAVEAKAYPLADDAFANLFAGTAVDPEDSRAAAVLSAAVAHPPRKTPSPTVPRPAVTTAPQDVHESEEDVKRFREWLDGLSES
jgi:tetratricopeptide (TPR) repeat protein